MSHRFKQGVVEDLKHVATDRAACAVISNGRRGDCIVDLSRSTPNPMKLTLCSHLSPDHSRIVSSYFAAILCLDRALHDSHPCRS